MRDGADVIYQATFFDGTWRGHADFLLKAVDPDRPSAFDADDRQFLERVAVLISPYCLVGWDTGGEPWRP